MVLEANNLLHEKGNGKLSNGVMSCVAFCLKSPWDFGGRDNEVSKCCCNVEWIFNCKYSLFIPPLLVDYLAKGIVFVRTTSPYLTSNILLPSVLNASLHEVFLLILRIKTQYLCIHFWGFALRMPKKWMNNKKWVHTTRNPQNPIVEQKILCSLETYQTAGVCKQAIMYI